MPNRKQAGCDFSWDDGDEAEWFIQVGEYPILVWQIGPGDIYADGRNNLRDWAVFAEWWMRDDCGALNCYCEWADMDFSGDVGVEDLALLAEYWLEAGVYD